MPDVPQWYLVAHWSFSGGVSPGLVLRTIQQLEYSYCLLPINKKYKLIAPIIHVSYPFPRPAHTYKIIT